MQRGSIINFNNAGRASCLLLLAIMGLALSPAAAVATYAEEADDYGVSTYSTLAASGVTIGFDKVAAEASVTPVDSTVMPVYADILATVTIADSGGYSVYVGSTNKDNTLTNEDYSITPISDTDCDAGVCDLASIPVGKWGYSFKKVADDGDTGADHDNYEAVPLNARTDAKDSGGVTKEKIQKKYALSFAANVDSSLASGTYSGSVTMSVVSNPREVVFDDITTMQQMSNPICTKAAVGDTKQLKDERDGKYYWVTKLRDNNCWMTQNLDLDIGTVTSSTSNVAPSAASWPAASLSDYTTAPNIAITNTAGRADSNTISIEAPLTRSWSLGDYRFNYENSNLLKDGNSCGQGKHLISDCNDTSNTRFVAYTTPTSANGEVEAHYIVGNFYQWTLATANTTNGSASICPKGWKLPPNTGSGSFTTLVAPGGSGTQANIPTVKVLLEGPYYFVRGGGVSQNTSVLFDVAGSYGLYWASTPDDSNNAYFLRFTSSNYIVPSFSDNRHYGLSVRCIAR